MRQLTQSLHFLQTLPLDQRCKEDLVSVVTMLGKPGELIASIEFSIEDISSSYKMAGSVLML